MSNKYYEPGPQRGKRVSDLFDTIAPRYDLINDLQSFGAHRYWKRRLLQLAGADPGVRALDLCCGTGDIALALARQGAATTGLDFSGAMLGQARRRAAADADLADRLRFVQGDAQNLPFPDDQFDIVSISYGLRNLSSWERGLEEMWRVARPGGRVLVLDFGKPRNPVWRRLYFGYLRLFVPLMGRVFFGDPDTHGYILESLLHYPAQEGVAERMRRMRFRDVRVVHLLGGIMSINYGVKTAG